MKRIILLLAIEVISLSCFADEFTKTPTFDANTYEQGQSAIKINETNFPDEAFRNYLLTHYYFCKDSVLTRDEIALLYDIDVSDLGIKSLKGIENLTEMTNIVCTGNELVKLDVSKNTALKYLNCSHNKLTSLNVSGCTALGTMICNDNLLTTLDVSACTELDYFSCINNRITMLDVSLNVAMTNLSCSNNQLSTLDLTGCTAIKSLYCDGNLLTELNLSKNKNLQCLNCGNNKLATLDVSHNTELFWIAFQQNQIKGIGMDALLQSLPTVDNRTMNVLYSENEQNIITKAQVKEAKDKGWTPYAFNGNNWEEYSGCEAPQPTDGITTPTLKQQSDTYDLQGRPVSGKQRHGLYIRGGRVRVAAFKLPAGATMLINEGVIK